MFTSMRSYPLLSMAFHYHIYHIRTSLLRTVYSLFYKVYRYVVDTLELVLIGFPKTTVHFA